MRYFVPDIRVAAELPPQRSLEDKLGGLPWGLEPSRWPQCADCGTSMSLLAQFAHHPERLDLGREGRSLLAFQCNHDPGMCQTWDGRSGANASFVLEPEAVVPRLAEIPLDAPVIENEVRVARWIARDDGIPCSMAERFFGVAEVPDEFSEMPTWSTRLGSVPRWLQSPLDAPAGWRFVGQLDNTYSFLTPPAAPPPWISPDEDRWEGRTHDAAGPNFGDGGIAYIFLRELPARPRGSSCGSAAEQLELEVIVSEAAQERLTRAASLLGAAADLGAFRALLARGDIHGAADELRRTGDAQVEAGGVLAPDFWEDVRMAYHLLRDEAGVTISQLRCYEAKVGFVEARLTLTRTDEGGRSGWIATDYRPSWDIGNRTASGGRKLNDARVSLEDCAKLAPGETGLVRLHPLCPEAWTRVQPGDRITMLEGSRLVGRAEVVRVTLKAAREGAATE